MAKNSADRFYLMQFPGGRDIMWGDIGSNLTICGLVVEGPHGPSGEMCQFVLLRSEGDCEKVGASSFSTITMNAESWSEFIRFSDDPQVMVDLQGKIFQRKLRFQISGEVQQKVWNADNCTCVYCGRRMGEVLLTIDHFIPLELGGVNDTSNYLTACKPCNKRKGNQHPSVALSPNRYMALTTYLAERKRDYGV